MEGNVFIGSYCDSVFIYACNAHSFNAYNFKTTTITPVIFYKSLNDLVMLVLRNRLSISFYTKGGRLSSGPNQDMRAQDIDQVEYDLLKGVLQLFVPLLYLQ